MTLAAALVLGGCPDNPVGQDAGDTGVTDATVPDARIDAQVPDGHVPPDVVQYDFCNEPFFKLPIDGQVSETTGIVVHQRKVAWSNRPVPDPVGSAEVFLLDLDTCLRTQLTVGSWAGSVSMGSDDVVWADLKDGWDTYCYELYRYGIATGVTERLTESPQCEVEVLSSGKYLAFQRSETPIDARSLHLLDRDSGIIKELAGTSTAINSFDLNEKYVVYAGYGGGIQAIGRDVYWYDLSTGESHHLDATYPRYQEWVLLWNDWVSIRGTDSDQTGPSYLELYNLVTQETTSIIEGDFSVSAGWINDGLVLYNTSAYTGTENLNPSDLELYEMNSAVSRRLTTVDSNLRARGIDLPYALIIHRLFLPSPGQNDFYIANLEALGVIDASGVLIPGGPVIDPP